MRYHNAFAFKLQQEDYIFMLLLFKLIPCQLSNIFFNKFFLILSFDAFIIINMTNLLLVKFKMGTFSKLFDMTNGIDHWPLEIILQICKLMFAFCLHLFELLLFEFFQRLFCSVMYVKLMFSYFFNKPRTNAQIIHKI